ncbi:hypothetical protein N0V86_005304 [Didymella sp. IMI 355093]|nr:hypothetical protein N0V86_005304 [Didymella sp. IMI 355093]
MATSGIGALFNGASRAPPPRPQPRVCSYTHPHIYANWKYSDKYDDMHPHDSRLKEIGIELKRRKHTQPASRTSDEDFVVKEETPDKKRKHAEINKMQILHRQPVVDAARAVDMDELQFDQPFSGFNYATNPDSTRWGPYHHDPFHPPNHSANGGRAFYDETSIYSNSMPDSFNLAQSLSGNTLVSESFVPDSFGATYPPHDDGIETSILGSFGAAETLFADGVDPFSSASFGNAELSHVDGAETFVPRPFDAEPTYPTDNDAFASAPFAVEPDNVDATDDHDEDFKQEDTQEHHIVSAAPAEDSEFAASESEDERPRKTPKLNKDGVPRKPRQPRAKLLKWSDDDWKNVCLGIVWACGETGVQIPFEQAAQVVGEKCTAGALQQALLKLRGKQVDAGHSIPSLKMAWTRKNKPATLGKAKASLESEANKPRKKPTRFEATQSLIITLPRAYTNEHREGLQAPYKWKKPPRKVKSANVKQDPDASFPYTPGGSQHLDYLSATPSMTSHLYETPPVTPFGSNVGYLQGMVLGGGEYANPLTTEGLQEVGNGWDDAADDVFGL